MQPATLPADLRAIAPHLAARVAVLLARLAAIVAHVLRRNPGLAVPLWTRLGRIAARLVRHAAHLAAGHTPRPARPSRPGPSDRPNRLRLPTRHGWLIAELRHEAANYASQLATILAEPAIADLLAASPATARLLRPLRHMLGLPADQPAARPSAPPHPQPEPAEPPRPAPAPRAITPRRAEPPCPHVRWPWLQAKLA